MIIYPRLAYILADVAHGPGGTFSSIDRRRETGVRRPSDNSTSIISLTASHFKKYRAKISHQESREPLKIVSLFCQKIIVKTGEIATSIKRSFYKYATLIAWPVFYYVHVYIFDRSQKYRKELL